MVRWIDPAAKAAYEKFTEELRKEMERIIETDGDHTSAILIQARQVSKTESIRQAEALRDACLPLLAKLYADCTIPEPQIIPKNGLPLA